LADQITVTKNGIKSGRPYRIAPTKPTIIAFRPSAIVPRMRLHHKINIRKIHPDSEKPFVHSFE
jgi:hypothetical protein